MPDLKNAEVEEVIGVKHRVVAPDNFLDWCNFAVADMARSVEKLNRDLDADRNNQVIWRDVTDILSLRRWAFVFPGGGAVRGGRRSRVRIRPAVPGQTRRSRPAPPATASTTPVASQPQPATTPAPTKGSMRVEASSMSDRRR